VKGPPPARRERPRELPRSLCAACRHARVIRNAKGSVFLFCRRSGSEAAFPRYPPQPVVECRGFQS
jgi:hypothetical protein